MRYVVFTFTRRSVFGALSSSVRQLAEESFMNTGWSYARGQGRTLACVFALGVVACGSSESESQSQSPSQSGDEDGSIPMASSVDNGPHHADASKLPRDDAGSASIAEARPRDAAAYDDPARDASPDASAPIAPPPAISFACPSGTATLVAGVNSVTVAGKTRSFNLDLPSDVSRPLGVLFSWHGFNDSWTHHRQIAGLDPNANPALPVVVVTPDDTGIQPPSGLDWDIVRGSPDNPDLAFFEAMLGCLHEQLSLDTGRIYSFGFSAGSVMTSLLHSRYPKLLSAVVAASGGWFNDAAEAKLVNLLSVKWSWPALDPTDQGAVLLTHGGATDVTVLNVLDLEKSAQAAFPFLKANNRVVVDCAHNRGHALHPEVTGAVVSKFISAHRAGAPSPYLSGNYAATEFPASCQLRLP